MPLYEYQCSKCGHRFEKIQLFSDKPIKKCPVCGGAVEKLLSAPAVQFKGTGWYVTDYAKKSAPPSSESSEGGSAKSESADSGAKSEDSAGKGEKHEKKDSKHKAESSSGKKSHKK